MALLPVSLPPRTDWYAFAEVSRICCMDSLSKDEKEVSMTKNDRSSVIMSAKDTYHSPTSPPPSSSASGLCGFADIVARLDIVAPALGDERVHHVSNAAGAFAGCDGLDALCQHLLDEDLALASHAKL